MSIERADEKEKYLTLQNILLPQLEICDEKEMYYRSNSSLVENNKLFINKNSYCFFNTYFNSFSLEKWLKYTRINNLYLKLFGQGSVIIEIIGTCWFNDKVIEEVVCRERIELSDSKEIEIKYKKNYLNIYFKILALDKGITINKGEYYTKIESVKLNEISISLVMCTFKKENYLKKNVEVIKKNILNNPNSELKNFFTVKIIDNGETLIHKEIEDENIKLYYNKNVGGAGGFTKGIIETINSEHKSTHILLMDDDVLIEPEAIEKTFKFLKVIREEYYDSFIGGSMLKLDEKYMQHESGASWRGTFAITIKHNLDLRSYKNVVFNEKEEKINNHYSAWWYCLFSTNVAKEDNLPFPFFIRGDDMEYSLRNNKVQIHLNGICVWHEAFENKYSPIMENYFAFRNTMVINTRYFNFNAKNHLKFLFRRIIREICVYNYSAGELLLEAAKDFVNGEKIYEDFDYDILLKNKMKKIQKIEDISIEVPYEKFQYEKYKETGILKKIFRWVTLNGHLIPKMFFKDMGLTEYGYKTRIINYFMFKRVLAYDINIEKGMIMEHSKIKAFKLLIKYFSFMFGFIIVYPKVKKFYMINFDKYKTVKFWKKKLNYSR